MIVFKSRTVNDTAWSEELHRVCERNRCHTQTVPPPTNVNKTDAKVKYRQRYPRPLSPTLSWDPSLFRCLFMFKAAVLCVFIIFYVCWCTIVDKCGAGVSNCKVVLNVLLIEFQCVFNVNCSFIVNSWVMNGKITHTCKFSVLIYT